MFDKILEEKFHQQIYDALNDDVMENYDQYDLTRRADLVNEALSAYVDSIEIIRVSDISQEDSEVYFKVLVSASIDIEDYAYGEDVSENITQWFQLSCSALLEDAEMDDFSVDEIEIYNK